MTIMSIEADHETLTDSFGRRWVKFTDWPSDDGWVASPPNWWGFAPGFEGCVLDVGAHVGAFTIPMALRGRRVFSVEGSPRNVRSLLASASLNGCEGLITPMRMAAWNEDTELSWFESDQTGSHICFDSPVKVTARRLSAELFEDRIGLVKIDVEGAEPQVLQGMQSLIERDRPFLIIEDHSRHAYLISDPRPYRKAILLESYSWVPVDPFTNGCVQWLGRPN